MKAEKPPPTKPASIRPSSRQAKQNDAYRQWHAAAPPQTFGYAMAIRLITVRECKGAAIRHRH